MQEASILNKVAEFHTTFKHPIQDFPNIPNGQRCELRLSLITEELNELRNAIIDGNITQVADALCDLQYVLSGTILEFGLGEKFGKLFDEVHRSNMSKACSTEEEALLTIEYYKKVQNTECYYKTVDDLYLVYRTSDNKTLKSINYSIAELDPILIDSK